jgi:hypothetical protein
MPGLDNTMADNSSRMHHLSDSQLLAYFDLTYPQTLSLENCDSATRDAFRCTLGLTKDEARKRLGTYPLRQLP